MRTKNTSIWSWPAPWTAYTSISHSSKDILHSGSDKWKKNVFFFLFFILFFSLYPLSSLDPNKVRKSSLGRTIFISGTITRKRGDISLDDSGIHPQKTEKDKSKEAANKLEWFAHNPAQSTGNIQLPRTWLSPAPSMTLKGLSLQNKSSKMTPTPPIPPTPTVAGLHDLSALDASKEEEPSLREMLIAVNVCKTALTEMTDQLNCITEEMAFFRHDLQKVRECTSELEGRGSVELRML